MRKRVIFDLDGTLLSCDYEPEFELFRKHFGEDASKFNGNIGYHLGNYEKKFRTFEKDELTEYLKKETGLVFTRQIIDEWIDVMANIPDKLEDGVIELLDGLKEDGHSLVVLTNWFLDSQMKRLERAGIAHYFDEIIGGDMCLKPYPESYKLAKGNFESCYCIMIGDHPQNDYIGALEAGFDAILYDKDGKNDSPYNKVERMNEVRRIINGQ